MREANRWKDLGLSDHETYSDELIRRILRETRTIAMVGASANPARPSNGVLHYLIGKGYRVFPVNPGHADKEIAGQLVYARLSDIPEPWDMVDIFRRADAVGGVVDEVLKLQPLPKVIWMQLGIRDDAAAARAEAAGTTVIMNRCLKIEYSHLMS
jgi:predicted CoA-binding protein